MSNIRRIYWLPLLVLLITAVIAEYHGDAFAGGGCALFGRAGVVSLVVVHAVVEAVE